jgi:hypothetical protein
MVNHVKVQISGIGLLAPLRGLEQLWLEDAETADMGRSWTPSTPSFPPSNDPSSHARRQSVCAIKLTLSDLGTVPLTARTQTRSFFNIA